MGRSEEIATMDKQVFQLAASTLLIVASYITITCPCERLNACHLGTYFATVGGATAIILYCNFVAK
jgi:hypothetical protein